MDIRPKLVHVQDRKRTVGELRGIMKYLKGNHVAAIIDEDAHNARRMAIRSGAHPIKRVGWGKNRRAVLYYGEKTYDEMLDGNRIFIDDEILFD